jgi:hypothetical protein
MWKKRKMPEPAAEEPAPHVDWLVQFRQEQRRKEEEEQEAVQALSDEEEMMAAQIQAAINKQNNAQTYATLVSNVMNMKHQTASNIIGNMRS